MDLNEAKALARSYLSEQIEIEHCEPAPDGLYHYNENDHYILSYSLGGYGNVGASDCVAVSKSTGEVGYAGRLGE